MKSVVILGYAKMQLLVSTRVNDFGRNFTNSWAFLNLYCSEFIEMTVRQRADKIFMCFPSRARLGLITKCMKRCITIKAVPETMENFLQLALEFALFGLRLFKCGVNYFTTQYY